MDFNLFLQNGAVIRSYKKGEIIVKEGGKARFFLAVYSGEVKMYNTSDDGQEFIL
jgi:CRP-like cAMP-binding protein